MVATPAEIKDQPRVLTLDGGGIRGLSSLLILQNIMDEVGAQANDPDPRPYKYFDLIGGTSTGGLIAIMLGRLGMTVQECITAYMAISTEVFKVDQVLKNTIPLGENQDRFSSTDLMKAVKAIIKKHLDSDTFPMSGTSEKPSCRTFVVTKMARNLSAQPTLFRSYNCEGFRADNVLIWQAALATSAAPTFFQAIEISNPPGNPAVAYVDGGVGYNNPTQLARLEARRIWPESKSCCLVTIGTGRPRPVRIDYSKLESHDESERLKTQNAVVDSFKAYIPGFAKVAEKYRKAKNFPAGVMAVIQMAGAVSKLITSSEDVHQNLETEAGENNAGGRFPYFRFNVQREVGDIGLGDTTQMSDMNVDTLAYMGETSTRLMKMACTEQLIAPHVFTQEHPYEGIQPVQTISDGEAKVALDNEIEQLIQLINASPGDHLLHRELAEAYKQVVQLSEVIEGWTSLVDRHPKEWKLHTQLANAFIERRTVERAVDVLRGSKRRKTGPTKSHVGVDEIATWKKLVVEHPDVWGLQVQLKKAFAKRDDINEEIKAWTDLVGGKPQDWKLHGELSEAYQKYADQVSSREVAMNEKSVNVVEQEVMCWRKLVHNHPDVWELQLRLADAYARKTRMEDVLRAMNYLKSQPKGLNTIRGLQARFVKKREVDDWKGLVDSHPESRGIQMQLEMAYNRKGNNEEALAGWKELVNKHPDQNELSIHLRRCYEKTTQNDDVQAEMKGWEDLVMEHPEARTLQAHLAEVYWKNGDIGREVAGWTELLNRHPEDAGLRDRLLYACQHYETYDEAMNGIQGLDLMDPRNEDIPSLLKQLF